ncbi:threonyl-tRNA synthetase [Methanohalobium evestigatum Z-7303]|uniref:Threonine--tRNA ligase n=1 Tax=Methanohalobium evestigatum (strain ATCC BAA-1072 / DSM 3721 / NBRC 107634 / OCM 161 / Z-7303) TaxID=644295 RepID=D7E858_METEZ|nr:threonine--tRNA ligase [Methanohalobium evestigatum]ADI73400.1 threonyl-tRNA synthetase [Methanohalobium evestigatum Z-7303]
MRLLLVHSDYIEYEVKKSTPVAEKVDESQKSGRLEEALTVFLAVEKPDESDIDEIVKRTVDEIKNVMGQINTDRIMLYPYAHLSNELSSPDTAVKALKKIEKELSDKYEVKRAPFGWYKSFNINCKGHPLSELSRTIRLESTSTSATGESTGFESEEEEVVSEALKAEETAKSYWYVLTPDGELRDVDSFDFSDHSNLERFVNYEISESRVVDKTPPHVELMKRLGIADYEQGSDSGNLRYYPRGRFIKSLLENYVLDEAIRSGAMEVETPIMYDMNHPTLKKYLDRFPARQYSIESDKRRLFLRFAACFGQFLMSHDMTISYKNLPLKMVEMTRYSFRKEQRGELVGMKRLRSFTMPDMHTFCEDMDQSISEFDDQYKMCINTLDNIGVDVDDYEVAIRFTRDFYENNKDFITEMAKTVNKPVLVEMWDTRFFYFVLKFEFNFIDALGKASALSTVQIDVENAETYDISYIDRNGESKRPTMLHCSPSGAIERCIYALLEKNAMKIDNGEVPMLPVWLSPTQVRIIPVHEHHFDFAEKIYEQLNCRVDIDDREDTVGKKIREAGREWIPYVVVIGDREIESGKLNVTIRSESLPKKPKSSEMTVEELNNRVLSEIQGMPYREQPLAKYVTKRPKFL